MDWGDVAASPQIVFIVGPRKRKFYVSKELLSRHSKVLDTLINGPMREAIEGRVHWEDVDEDTFLRFYQWAYTQDYTPAEPVAVRKPDISLGAQIAAARCPSLSSLNVIRPDPNEYIRLTRRDHSSYCIACQSVTFCPQCQDRYANEWQYRANLSSGTVHTKKEKAVSNLSLSDQYLVSANVYRPSQNLDNEDFSLVLLSHSRLYALADKYDIPALRQLSLHKLFRTLKIYKLFPDRIGDIGPLVRHAFEHTMEGDKLRELLVEYCACVIDHLIGNEGFKEMINETPDFGTELIQKMRTFFD